MSRECASDLRELLSFIESYRIVVPDEASPEMKLIKQVHKQFFALVTLHSELSGRKADFIALPSVDEFISLRISEAISDVASAFFCWLHGARKPAKVMLRAAIENFLRALATLEDKQLATEGLVYRLLESAGRQNQFQVGSPMHAHFSRLRSRYGDLCADVHTAHPQNMVRVSALGDFPSTDIVQQRITAALLVEVIKTMNILFCVAFRSFFHGMHHRNRENVMNALPPTVRQLINGPQD